MFKFIEAIDIISKLKLSFSSFPTLFNHIYDKCKLELSQMDMAKRKLNFLFVVSVLLALTLTTKAAPKEDLIVQVPGFNGTLPSPHYGGYVSFNEKNLYYYFIVSERNLANDPVVLWLNGGPGCSSFDGFVYEHGPFNYEKGTQKDSFPKLHLNPYSWSKVSNIIYLDSPCGVGLSYSNNTNNYETDDWKTAADSHTFLLKWFQLYPEFLKNPFYISGESYAGIYVPTLSYEVVKGINAGVQPVINFQGYLVGNGVSGTDFDGTLTSLVPFSHGMGLISDDIYEEVQANCYGNGTENGCSNGIDKVYEAIDGLNIYDILEPCYHDPYAYKGNSSLPPSFQKLGETEKPMKVRKRMFGRAWPLKGHLQPGTLWPELADQYGSVLCFDDEVATAWLNDESVRKAIHAQPISVAGKWELCSSRISYARFSSGSMLPYHKNLTTEGYRALIYSGDHDMCVPFPGTQAWTRSLGYKIVDQWRSWISNDQIAGYLQGYDYNLTFLTIKGAGHTVPEYKPRESLDFYSRWLDNTQI